MESKKYQFKVNDYNQFVFEGTEEQAVEELEKYACYLQAGYNSRHPVVIRFEEITDSSK